MNKIVKQKLFIFLFILCNVFISCSDSAPLLDTVYFTNFTDADSKNERMAVFVELKSSVENINTITIKHVSSEKEWIIDNPEIIYDKKMEKYYCGSSNLVPEKDGSFPGGEYIVLYKDRAGREVETEFFYIKNK
jgi:hypothetical protein